MDLVLNYKEAIDFILYLKEDSFSHEKADCLIDAARKVLCSYLFSGEPDAEGVITFTPGESYKFKPVERDSGFWIEMNGSFLIVEHVIEKEKYSSDGIRAYMENKSLMDRLNTPADTSDKKQPAETETEALKAENERLKAELKQKNKTPAQAKPARDFILNLIKKEYPNGEFKGWKRESVATEAQERAKAAGFGENDIPTKETITRHYFNAK